MDFVEQLKSTVDIVNTIGEYVRLKKSGAGPRYTGLCPFHTEKTPSFSVHGGHQFYKCFGCGAGGDVIKFVMELERIQFYDALKLLAERNGLAMPQRSAAPDAEGKLRGVLLDMHDAAARIFHANLAGPNGAQAREYLLRRGVAPEHWTEFHLGLSDAGGQQLTRRFTQDGHPPELLEKSGLVLRRQEGGGFFDRFRGRLMFPIHNESGKVIAFGGRALRADDEPKYLNSPETDIYKKTYVLYNLHRAKNAIRKLDRAVLVEGYMDVIGVYSAGVQEVVASCGTALTSTQVRALSRHTRKIVVNFDPDSAGAQAAERSMQLLRDEEMSVRVLELLGGLDPDEYIRKHGAENYRDKLKTAPHYYHWMADRGRKKFDTRSAEGKMEAWRWLLPIVERIGDRIERAAVAKDMAAALGVDEALVLERFRKATPERRAAKEEPQAHVPGPERLLLKALLTSAEARAAVIPRLLELNAIESFQTRGIFEALIAVVAAGAFRYADLEARISENDRKLLSTVAFADEIHDPEHAEEQAVDCLRVLEGRSRDQDRESLEVRIRAAERGGDMAEAFRLTEQLDRLLRR